MIKKDYRNIARQFRDKGLVVIPLDDKKQPYNPQNGTLFPWHWFQERLPSDSEIEKYYNGCNSLGLLTGMGIEAVDCDAKYFTNPHLMTEFREALPQELFNKLVIQQSKNMGYHWVFKSSAVEPNQKLACRETTDAEVYEYYCKEFIKLKSHKKAFKSALNFKSLVLLETRGGTLDKRMGYIVIADPEKTIDNGYKLLRGSFLDIPEITVEERNLIIETARKFNEIKQEVSNYKAVRATKGESDVFDRYNNEADGLDILLEHGWTINEGSSKGKDKRMVRPGNPDSDSSGLFDTERNLFVCYSTSCGFEINKGYPPVNLLAELAFEGDFVKTFNYLKELYERN